MFTVLFLNGEEVEVEAKFIKVLDGFVRLYSGDGYIQTLEYMVAQSLVKSVKKG